jgi:hypothetical protein
MVFERILSLNPNDNQGVRFCWEDVRKGRTWVLDARARASRTNEVMAARGGMSDLGVHGRQHLDLPATATE